MNKELNSYLQEFHNTLSSPDDFSFPFIPYEIQTSFMSQLYEALENKKLGIFESPTGTGKSLSLICGALSWLRDHEERINNQFESALLDIDLKRKACKEEPGTDWLIAQNERSKLDNIRRLLCRQMDNIAEDKKRIAEIRCKIKENKNTMQVPQNVAVDDDPLQLDKPDDWDIILDEEFEPSTTDSDELEDLLSTDPPVKIIFCSRTHSQLAQFIGEIMRTNFANDMRVVSMASRQNCCINKAVKKLSSLSLMNEKCLEMMKSGKKKTEDENCKVIKKVKGGKSCPYLKNVQFLSDAIISEVMDLEVIVKKGESLSACPYYGTRAAAADCQVIVVPYNTLLHKSTRESNQINIKNAVIIIDEAHNLLETVSHIHSVELSGQQLTYAFSQLNQYKDRYQNRLSSTNLLFLNQLIFILKSLIRFIDGKNSEHKMGTGDEHANIYTVSSFILTAKIDNYNLFKIVEFCNKSKISQKIRGFTEKYDPPVNSNLTTTRPKAPGMKSFLSKMAQQKTTKKISKPPGKQETTDSKNDEQKETLKEGQPLIPVISFLNCLTMSYKEGRIVVQRQSIVGKSQIKYLLLDPTSVMKEVIQESRSVILAGGTMKPFSEFRDRLFLACGADESRIVEFSCDHVIPKENILPMVITSGPTSQTLEFSFQKRNSENLIDEIGRILINVCNIIPAGVVCFFPSYDYENYVYSCLETRGFLKKISVKKKLFREPKSSSQVDSVLKEYAIAAQNRSQGALMFSVVGGKLSEGLNFSDDLGRCVIVVGMPYPNITSPELKEKMSFLNKTVGPQAGREYYENCCMKAVNQCIGRAVRHQGDYSTVLLLDQRYKSPHCLQQLPKWIYASLLVQTNFGSVQGQLAKFFKCRKS